MRAEMTDDQAEALGRVAWDILREHAAEWAEWAPARWEVAGVRMQAHYSAAARAVVAAYIAQRWADIDDRLTGPVREAPTRDSGLAERDRQRCADETIEDDVVVRAAEQAVIVAAMGVFQTCVFAAGRDARYDRLRDALDRLREAGGEG